MVFGGALGIVLIGLVLIYCIRWLIIRFLLIYLKWSYQIEIKYSSIGLFDIENLSIQHQFFHLNIKHLHVLFSFSIFIWRLPLVTINDSLLKINSIPKSTSNKKKPKKNWKSKLYFLKYISIRIDRLKIEYDNSNISFQRISFDPTDTLRSTSSDMRLACEYVDLSIIDNSELDQSGLCLFKSTWKTIEIQTDLDQRLLINSNHWSSQLNHKLFDYFRRKQAQVKSPKSTLNFRYIDPNFLTTTPSTSSNQFFAKFDQWLEYFDNPFLNLSIENFDLTYISIHDTSHLYRLDTVHLSFHNSSKSSSETRHAYVANFRLISHSTFLVHGLCQLTIFPVRIDLACQFNEFTVQLREETLEEFHRLFSSRSSSSSKNRLQISDRQIDLSFQFLNPSIRLKMVEMTEWFHWQMNFCKILIRSNEQAEMKSIIELRTLAIYTSEMDLETSPPSFIDDLNKKHFWNCLCYLPNANLTISTSQSTHVQVEITGIRLQLNKTLLTVVQHLQRLKLSRKKSMTNSKSSLDVSLQMKSSILIICDTFPVYLCFSISSIRFNRSQMEMKKILAFFNNQPSEDIPVSSLNYGQKILDLRRVNLQYIPINSTIQISVVNDLTLVWSTKLHLFLFRFISAWKSTNEHRKSEQSSSMIQWNSIEFLVEASAHVYLQLSNDCRIHMELQQFSSQFLRHNQTQMKLRCAQLLVDWQQQCSFVIQDVSFTRLLRSESLTTERILLQKTITTIDMLQNRASFVEINSFSIRFPFDSSFNEVIEKMINIRKWLKRLHRTNGDMSSDFLQQVPQHTVSDEVWTDLSIKINDFELTIVDDLFEVKLFQNYCLMADEYQERELREQALQRHIDDYENISQPFKNINELKRALSEASSKVYIERSQKTNYDENNQRIKRNLIRWHLRQVDLIALADQSWTGKENILNIIHQIDADSPKIPIDTTDLCTMWCRYVILKCEEWSIHFRDFRQPLWQMQQFHLWGHICAAETTPVSIDSIRTPWVEIGEPYTPNRVPVQRLLSPMKFYHDINSDIDSFLFSYGPAWENTMAQFNICLNTITPRASDPSPLLPWWDKIRLYLHGRWSFAVNKMSWLYHVASSPYNDTEEMEWFWDQAYVDWTNGKITVQALSLSIKLRTSSKYDDCCLLYLPNVDARMSLNWLCAGNSNDHHAVRLYTRDAVKSWQKQESHDSYTLFRSHHVNAAAKFECKEVPLGSTPPTVTVYASTLRFCERVKNTMMSITRPTRRGRLFLAVDETVVPPRKPLLSRHYEAVEFQLIVPQFRVKYLTSFARQTGAQVDCQLFNFITYQELNLINHHDGLARRAKILWKPKMMNVNLKRAQMWLIRDANEDQEINEMTNKFDHQGESQQQRTFLISLDSLVYIRSSATTDKKSTHSVLIGELKGVWNLTNRRTLFLVYERYRRNNILRSNLSNPFAKELEHLQQEKYSISSSDPSPSDENTSKTSLTNDESHHSAAPSMTGTTGTGTGNGTLSQPSTLASFLDQLINESQHKPSADLDPTADASVSLVGPGQCTKDDVEEHTLRIELSDSQIALRGIESGGYVIMSAAVACVDQYRHKPVWRDEQLCDKTSWHANLQGMQYFATTIPSSSSSSHDPNNNLSSILLSSGDDADEITWIPRRDIRDENSLLGESSRSVIGSIATNNGRSDQQLQCIISKSNATLSYVFYTEQTQQEEETDTNIVIPPFTKPSINESNPIGESDRLLVDSFTFIHNDIQLSTNSSQYRTIMDIVNNLLLYVEPKEEGTSNKLRKVRLQIQLANNLPVLRESIRHLLERVRSKLAELRRLEREIYYYSRPDHNLDYSSDEEDGQNGGRVVSFTSEEYEQLQISYSTVKIESTKLAERLGMMCAVYKDMQLARIVKLRIAANSTKMARLERRYELYGGSITWFIKHDDGQITNAQFLLRNILYTKRYFENGTNEHSIIIGQAQVDNLLPDDRYRTILTSNCQQQHTMIRVYCKEGEPVGGIAVKEHLEINVAPLVIQMTRRFSQMLMAFLFPNKNHQQQQQQQPEIPNANKSAVKHPSAPVHKRRTRSAEGDEELLPNRSLFYFSNRDLDAMEKRAKNTLAFHYIKIPEVSLIVSYKIRGTKEKKIGDLENAHISFPTLEYRNLTCSWHDLVLAIKSDVKTVLLSQAIRQNINLRLPFIGRTTRAQNQQLLATTIGESGLNNSAVLYNSDTINSNEISNNSEQEEEEQKHKMKLVLGTKISKDLLNQLKRRKDT